MMSGKKVVAHVVRSLGVAMARVGNSDDWAVFDIGKEWNGMLRGGCYMFTLLLDPGVVKQGEAVDARVCWEYLSGSVLIDGKQVWPVKRYMASRNADGLVGVIVGGQVGRGEATLEEARQWEPSQWVGWDGLQGRVAAYREGTYEYLRGLQADLYVGLLESARVVILERRRQGCVWP